MDQRRHVVGRHKSHIQRPIKHIDCREEHQKLASAGNGAVYLISRPANGQQTKVVLKRTVHNDSIACTSPGHFRSTTRPMASSDKLYLGVRMLANARPAVLVWTATSQFFCSLQSDRRESHDWEYTFLMLSYTGNVLYCGCSDGAIEVWNRVSEHARVYVKPLKSGHVGRICSLAVGQDGTMLSVDTENANIVRIWRSLTQVAKLDLGQEKVRRMVCTRNKNLYVSTEAGSKLWCNLTQVLARVDHSSGVTSPRINRSRPVFGLDVFSFLQGLTRARSCLAVGGDSETVCFLCSPTSNHDTVVVEEWHSGEFVSRVDTQLREFKAWTLSRHGTLYFSI